MSRTPGATLPGTNTKGRDTPGKPTPDLALGATNTESSTGVAVDATGTTTLGTTDEIEGEVEAVTVTPTAADFSFNIIVDGTSVFPSTQSPSAASEETFEVPADVDAAIFYGAGATVEFEVTSASTTGGATADVSAEVESEEQR